MDERNIYRRGFRWNERRSCLQYCRVLSCGIALLIIGSAARADTVLVQSEVFLQVPDQTYDSGSVPSLTQAHDIETHNCIDGIGCGDAFASATVAPGVLEATATAATELVSTIGPIQSVGEAQLKYLDTITLTSSTFPAGTPVDLDLFQTLDGTLQGAGDLYEALVISSIQVGDGFNQIAMCVFSSPEECPPSFSNVFHGLIGGTYSLQAQLFVEARSVNNSSAEALFGDTAHYYVKPTVDGVSIQSASGYSYTPVPEPATLPTVVLVLSLVAWRLKQKTTT